MTSNAPSLALSCASNKVAVHNQLFARDQDYFCIVLPLSIFSNFTSQLSTRPHQIDRTSRHLSINRPSLIMAGSGVSSLATVPPEILLAVFQSCVSLEQLSALMSTCRQMHNIWTHHHPVII
jgi:hypothetical protein